MPSPSSPKRSRKLSSLARQLLRLAGPLAVAAIVVANTATASAGEPARVAATPASAEVVVGEAFELDYTVASVPATPGVGGYVLALQWDPRLLALVSLSDAGFVTGGDNIVICGAPVIKQESGEAVLFCATIPIFSGPGVSTVEPAVFARSTFRALAAGRTSVELEGSYLDGPAEQAIPATLTGATVTIAGPASTEPPADTTLDEGSTSPPTPALIGVKPPAAGSGYFKHAGSEDGRAWLLAATILALSGAVASGLTLQRTRAGQPDNARRTRGR